MKPPVTFFLSVVFILSYVSGSQILACITNTGRDCDDTGVGGHTSRDSQVVGVEQRPCISIPNQLSGHPVLLPWEPYLRIITICVHYDIARPELREPRVMKTLQLHSRRRELHFLALFFFLLIVLSQSLSIYKHNFIFQKMLTQLLWEIKYDNPLWIFKIVLKCSAITAL